MGLLYKDGIPYGGGGHIIVNSGNEALPQRNRVQINGANIVDDPQHDKTILNIENVDISGKADKVSNAINDNFAALDVNGNLKDSGHKHSDYLTQHQDISGKADKVSNAINGHLAALDSNGNLIDSGKAGSEINTLPINPTAAQISTFSNGAIWLVTE